MHSIISFARLDFITLKPYAKSLLLLLTIAIIMGVAFHSLYTMSLYLMMCLILVMTYPFSIGEANRLDTLYAALPLRRRNMVRGRYLFVCTMELFTVLLILIISLGLSLFTNLEFVAAEMLFYLCTASFLFTVIVALQYPIYFKLGYNKAKFLAYAPLLLVVLAVMLLPKLLPNIPIGTSIDDFLQTLLSSPLVASSLPSYAAPVLLGHALLGLSCVLSGKLYAKRDI